MVCAGTIRAKMGPISIEVSWTLLGRNMCNDIGLYIDNMFLTMHFRRIYKTKLRDMGSVQPQA